MHIRRSLLVFASGLAVIAGAILPAAWASATVTTVTATTQISGRPDSGNGAGTYWANDSMTRTLVITTSGSCSSVPAGATCYSATVDDSGTFTTIPNRGSPNQNSPVPGTDAVVRFPAVTGKMAGQASYLFTADKAPSSSLVAAAEDDHGSVPADTTSGWYKLAFPTGTVFGGPGIGAWSWTYKTTCEQWADTSTNGAGNDSSDGNITGKTCPVAASNYGNYVNPFGNGFDVFRQHYSAGAVIAGWPATQHDPATRFFRETPAGAHWTSGPFRLEAAGAGGATTGLCVSNPMGGWPDPAGPTGLILTPCNGSVFQQFSEDGHGHLLSVVNGQFVNPAGTGAQLRTGSSVAPWGGSSYGWKTIYQLPA